MGVAATEEGGRHVDDVTIDQTGPVECAGDRRTALDEHLQHAVLGQLVQDRPEVALHLPARVDLGARGGGALLGSVFSGGHAQRLVVYVAPLALGARGTPALAFSGPGTIADARRYELTSVRRLGPDARLDYDVPDCDGPDDDGPDPDGVA